MFDAVFSHAYEILGVIFLLNLFAAIVTVFHTPRNIAATWAWLVVLIILPVFGFLLFMFTGRGMAHDKLFEIHRADRIGLQEVIADSKKSLPHLEHAPADDVVKARHLTVELFRRIDRAPLTRRNNVQIFIDGAEKFAALFADIKRAQHSIHIEYYTIYADRLGTELRDLLVERAQAGIKVRVVYDAFGSHGTTAKFWKPLTAVGGVATPFVTSTNAIARFRLNYHDHRKIVVIDGLIGYTGGFNVGDQYLGRDEKFGHWRDTHLRIEGSGVQLLQMRFMMDWNASVITAQRLIYTSEFFPTPQAKLGSTSLQVVTSGPDSTIEQIKLGYINLINSAKKRVWLQSPYLVPDDSMITALSVAAASGLDVRIMIPCMPDHAFIYRATQYYAKLLHGAGVKVYVYNNGFLHAKTMLVDDDMSSVGSANQDFRSYGLNFEVNTFMYDTTIVSQLATIFENDMAESTRLTTDEINSWSRWLRFKQMFSRLLSPIL